MDDGSGWVLAIMLGIVVALGAFVYHTIDDDNRKLTDEYNQVAVQQGWQPLRYDDHVDADDVRRAILCAKMGLKPTADSIMNAPKRPVNTASCVILRTGR